MAPKRKARGTGPEHQSTVKLASYDTHQGAEDCGLRNSMKSNDTDLKTEGAAGSRAQRAAKFWQDLAKQKKRGLNAARPTTTYRAGSRTRSVDGDDDVVESYDLHTNSPGRTVFLLQYPTRKPGERYSMENNQKPLRIRIKPKSGLVEVDVPINTTRNFNQVKSVDFGAALKTCPLSHQGGSFGLAGGLGVGPSRVGRATAEAPSVSHVTTDDLMENFQQARKDGYVMDQMTLSGRVLPLRDGDPIYMVATFDGNNATWTKVDAVVQLRTQYNHLDAMIDLEKARSRPERAQDSRGRDEKAEDVNMTIRDTADGDAADMYGGMSDTARLLRSIRDEPWQSIEWIDQSDQEAFDVYDQDLLCNEGSECPRLMAAMTDGELLDVISCPQTDAVTQGMRVTHDLAAGAESSDDSDDSESEEDAKDRYCSPQALTKDDSSTEPDTDLSDNEQSSKPLPDGVAVPNGSMERDIERLCRLLCLEPHDKRRELAIRFADAKGSLPRFCFLNADDQFHPYFTYRLDCNAAGQGILPDQD